MPSGVYTGCNCGEHQHCLHCAPIRASNYMLAGFNVFDDVRRYARLRCVYGREAWFTVWAKGYPWFVRLASRLVRP